MSPCGILKKKFLGSYSLSNSILDKEVVRKCLELLYKIKAI